LRRAGQRDVDDLGSEVEEDESSEGGGGGVEGVDCQIREGGGLREVDDLES